MIKFLTKPASTAALLLSLAWGVSAESVRWTVADKPMSPADGQPGCFTATLPPLPEGAAVDFTDGGAARTTAPYLPGTATELTVDSEGRVVPWSAVSGVVAPVAVTGDTELWFDLQGRPAANPSRGCFIRVKNGQTSKIYLNN